MPLSQQLQLLSDIVRDSKLETEIFHTYTQHVFYISGRSARERHVRQEERWVRDRFLGQGAYGTVYLERHEQGDKEDKLRAVKEIRKYVVAGQKLEYMRELEAIMKFSHPKYSHCFVRSDGWFENSESVFIAMEYLEHGDLHQHLTRPLPESEARTITLQVLEGLKFMHDNGFVHRDLKPGNIMVVTKGPEWFVKIADFGISKRRQQDVTSLRTVRRGTEGFAAPEAMGWAGLDNNPESYTAAVDMWSLGAVVHIMLTRTIPFSTPWDLGYYVEGKREFPLEKLQAHSVSRQGQEFIVALMAPDPKDRLSSATADKHPWATTPPLVDTSGTDVSGDTMISMASAAWSTAPEERREHADTQIRECTATHTEKATEPRITSYHVPYVENCADEDDRGNPTPSSSPHISDDIKDSSLPIRNSFPACSPPTPPPEPEETTVRPPAETRPSDLSPDDPEEELPPPMAYTRLRSPYSIHSGEKIDLFAGTRPKDQEGGIKSGPSRNAGKSAGDIPQSPPTVATPVVNVEDFLVDDDKDKNEIPGSTDGTDDKGSSKHEPVLLYSGVESHRDALARGSNYFNSRHTKKKNRSNTFMVECSRCELGKNEPDVRPGMLEMVPCGHVLCHYCLMERFALALVSPDYKLQCCDINIDLQPFRRILVDPEINRLWCTGYVRENNRTEGPDDDFILFLHKKEVLHDRFIISEIELHTGLKLPFENPAPDEAKS